MERNERENKKIGLVFKFLVLILGKQKLKEYLIRTDFPEYLAKDIANEINKSLKVTKLTAIKIGKFANEIGIKNVVNENGDFLYGRYQKIVLPTGKEVNHFLYNEEGKKYLISKWIELNKKLPV